MTNQTNVNLFSEEPQLPSQQELNECSQPVDVALLWASREFPVLPCQPGGSNAKAPYIKGGFKSATTIPAQILEWWAEHPDALIGGPIGLRDLVAVDLDIKPGGRGKDQLKDLETKHNFNLEWAGPVARTQSGGFHIIMKAPNLVGGLRANLKYFGAPQIDMKGGKSGYIILPGSVMTDGRRYDWEDGHDPTVVTPQFMPENLVKLAYKNYSKPMSVEELSSANYHSGPPLSELEEALIFVSADVPHDDWVEILMSAHHEYGDVARQIMDNWSQTAPHLYNAVDFKSAWESFGKNSSGPQKTIKSIFGIAKNNGCDLLALSKKHRDSRSDPAAGMVADSNQPWPAPQPLTAKIPPEPYPIEALPAQVRAVVEEVQGFSQAPLPMVATCALAAISIATQGHVDICRADGLSGPCSIYALGIADSGERKSTVDEFFLKPIRDYQSMIDEIAREAWDNYRKEKIKYDAEMAGLRAALSDAVKKDKPTDEIREKIDALQAPEEPKVPKYLFDDAIVSSEAGSVLGGHGMNPESVMRSLSLLNKLWSGETHDVSRRTSESFLLEGARFSISLQVQEKVLRVFFDKAGDVARGGGFLARFLILDPDSTQGYRPFKQPPKGWPALTAYSARMRALLETPIRFKVTPEGYETDIPDPFMLRFKPDAQQAWIDFYNEIEKSIRPGGEAHEVRDVASKTADNAARLAGSLYCYVHGPQGETSAEIFDGASRIAAWHLNEARRFLGEIALPQELADAVRLDTWLIKRAKAIGTSTIPKNETRQYGPVRDGKRLTAAIDELVSLERVRVIAEGRKAILQLNPGLI